MTALNAIATAPTQFGEVLDMGDALSPCRFIDREDLMGYFRSVAPFDYADRTEADYRLSQAWIGYWGATAYPLTKAQAIHWMYGEGSELRHPPHAERICVYWDQAPRRSGTRQLQCEPAAAQ